MTKAQAKYWRSLRCSKCESGRVSKMNDAIYCEWHQANLPVPLWPSNATVADADAEACACFQKSRVKT